jgi:uncharacterized protein
MKKLAITLLVLVFSASSAFASNAVRISQVYAGGGNSGAIYNQDFVELFNSSAVAVDISGWSLQYGSATGTTAMGSCTGCFFQFPAGTLIGPCKYLLVGGCGSTCPNVGPNGVPLPVAPDFTAVLGMGATSGKIGLKVDGVFTPVGSCPLAFQDEVGYGATANCFEGAGPAPAPSAVNADIRLSNGLTDTDNNSVDFFAGAPNPRNSASPANPDCTPVSTDPSSWGQVKSTYR